MKVSGPPQGAPGKLVYSVPVAVSNGSALDPLNLDWQVLTDKGYVIAASSVTIGPKGPRDCGYGAPEIGPGESVSANVCFTMDTKTTDIGTPIAISATARNTSSAGSGSSAVVGIDKLPATPKAVPGTYTFNLTKESARGPVITLVSIVVAEDGSLAVHLTIGGSGGWLGRRGWGETADGSTTVVDSAGKTYLPISWTLNGSAEELGAFVEWAFGQGTQLVTVNFPPLDDPSQDIVFSDGVQFYGLSVHP
jgi:hypothetical protein